MAGAAIVARSDVIVRPPIRANVIAFSLNNSSSAGDHPPSGPMSTSAESGGSIASTSETRMSADGSTNTTRSAEASLVTT